jgi:L-fuconolactonase
MAQETPILGVIGWAPIAAKDFPTILDDLRQNPLLKGLRHVVQAEPSQFLTRVDFQRGIHHLAGTGLVYDLLVYAHQLPEAIAFVDQFPAQSFVLDHMGKPAIAQHEIRSLESQCPRTGPKAKRCLQGIWTRHRGEPSDVDAGAATALF